LNRQAGNDLVIATQGGTGYMITLVSQYPSDGDYQTQEAERPQQSFISPEVADEKTGRRLEST